MADKDNQDIQDEIIRNNEEDISAEKVKEDIEKRKNGKAPEGGLPVEMIKAFGESGIVWHRELINDAKNTGEIPDDWEKAIVCLIFKS